MFESTAMSIVNAASLGKLATSPHLKVWGVFLLCFFFSLLGVGASFWMFGTTVTGQKLWGIGIVIAIIMLGISYGAKYANEKAREAFTPVDLIQYLSQGFLWPSTWPAMAELLGIEPIEPPVISASLLEPGTGILSFFT